MATGSRHICLTGGEPLIHDLEDLVYSNTDRCMIHIETSGTIDIPDFMDQCWITVSPKWEFLEACVVKANELKLLVHHQTTDGHVMDWKSKAEYKPLFLQPIDDGDYQHNLQRAMALALKHQARLSLQMHKHLGIR